MPYVQNGRARLYYEESGSGAPIIAIHGLSENTTYWSTTGVTARLAERYRVISTDMRGHGLTRVDGEPKGYDVESVASDLLALADALGFERFHLLGHATGGMACVRLAMRRSDRLLSLMATDTGSATLPVPPGTDIAAADLKPYFDGQAQMAEFYRTTDWDASFTYARQHPEPYLDRLDHAPDPVRAWQWTESILRRNDRLLLADFVTSFYRDPDPLLAELANIRCPTLVLLGEHDNVFIEPSRLLAEHIPGAKHVVLKSLGHMTAIEDPERTITALLDFLASVPAQ